VTRGSLFKTPVLQTDVERERHATWLELLYDLIFVAAVAQLASFLNTDFSLDGTLRFAFISILVWWAWAGHTFYLTRFDTADLAHRLLTLVQMIAVAALAVNVPDAFGVTSRAFALSYAAVRSILVVEYLRAGFHIPAARPLTNRYSAGFGAALLVWLVSCFIPAPLRYFLWGLAVAIDFLTPITATSIHVRFPPNRMHLPERFGLFTIIVIGEAVAGVVTGEVSRGLSPVSGLAGIMGLIISFTLWWGYFEGVRGAGIRIVSSFEHVGRYQLWLYAHLPLVMGITATAAGVRHVLALPALQPLPAGQAMILSGAVGISCLALNCIFLASYPADRSRELHRYLLPNYFIALLGILTGILGDAMPGVMVLFLLMLLCIFQVILELRNKP